MTPARDPKQTIFELKDIKDDLSINVFHPETGWPLPYYFRDIENKEQITEVFLEIYPVDFKNSEACQLFVTTQIHHDSDYLHIDKPDS